MPKRNLHPRRPRDRCVSQRTPTKARLSICILPSCVRDLAEDATVDMAHKSPARRRRSTSIEGLAPFEDDCVLVGIETPKGSPNKLTFEPRYGPSCSRACCRRSVGCPCLDGRARVSRHEDDRAMVNNSDFHANHHGPTPQPCGPTWYWLSRAVRGTAEELSNGTTVLFAAGRNDPS